MFRFIRDAVVFAIINLVLIGLLYARYNVGEDYLAAANDKYARLESVPAPRVLLIGGSSVAWSSHSGMIKDQLGVEVQNVAYHAGLGLYFRMEEVRQLAKPGDTVVMSIEWAVMPDAPRPRIMAEIFIACPAAKQFMNTRDLKLVLDGLIPAIRMPLVSLIEDGKRLKLDALKREEVTKAKRWRLRQNFTEMGDFAGHYTVDPAPGFEGKGADFPTRKELDAALDRINAVHVWCKENGVRLVYFIPIIPKSIAEKKKNVEVLQYCIDTLKNTLTMPILNPDTYVFSDDSFFDSAYHMKGWAGEKRTQVLVDGLAPHLDQPIPTAPGPLP